MVAYRNGAPVRLEDLGRVLDSVQNDKSANWSSGEPAVVLAVQRQPGTNTVEVVDNVSIAPRCPVAPGDSIEIRGELVHDPGRLPVVHWTHHDLRRTLDTVMNDRLGIPPHVVAAVLAHTSGAASGKAGSERHYNHAAYVREKSDALWQWSDFIMALVGENVVPLHRVG